MSKESLKGVVKRGGEPLAGCYVRLLGPTGDFVGEHRTRASGTFKFNLASGTWKLVWFMPGGARGERDIQIADGDQVDLEVPVD